MATLVPVLLFAGLMAAWAVVQERTQPRPPQTVAHEATTVAAPTVPRVDVPGEELAGLPRYPGSVRADYERAERGGLVLTDVRYLADEERPDAVRGFYRGVFRSEDWEEGDADFSGGVWTFFVTRDRHEATVEIEPRGHDVVQISVRSSEPRPQPRPSEKRLPAAAQYVPQTPAPSTVSAPGYDDGSGDD